MYQSSQDHTLLKDVRPKMRKLDIEVIVLQQESETIVTRDGKCIYWYLVADKSGIMVLKAWSPAGGMIKPGDILHISGIDIKVTSDRHLLEISRQGKIQRLGQDTFPFAENPNYSQPSQSPHSFSSQDTMVPPPPYATTIGAQQQLYQPSTTIRPPITINYTTSTTPSLQSDRGPTTTSIVNFGPGWMGGLGRNYRGQQRALPIPVMEQPQRGNYDSDQLTMESNFASNNKENATMNRRKQSIRNMEHEYKFNQIQSILSRRHILTSESENSLMDLRIFVLSEPYPPEKRGLLWKLLLRVTQLSSTCYISLVQRGPSSLDTKIKNDTFRTMTTDDDFNEHVSEDMLIRPLNAFIWLFSKDIHRAAHEEMFYQDKFKAMFPRGGLTYVQGMNVLLAPFLMVLPEMEAFFAFTTFMWQWCPLYVQPNLIGVHCGTKLVDLCLKELDPQLYYLLLSKGLTASTYAVPSVITFCACTPSSKELLRLWDLLFAFGLHLNILFIIAQLALIRTELIASTSPMRLLRKMPVLQAEKIIKITLASIKRLPPDLYEMLVRHAFDETVAQSLGIDLSSGITQHADLNTLPPYLADASI